MDIIKSQPVIHCLPGFWGIHQVRPETVRIRMLQDTIKRIREGVSLSFDEARSLAGVVFESQDADARDGRVISNEEMGKRIRLWQR